jgi:hypothetical protein
MTGERYKNIPTEPCSVGIFLYDFMQFKPATNSSTQSLSGTPSQN